MEKKKILIIDDENTNIAIAKSILDPEKYDILIAVDGQEGLDMAKDQMPDLILTDVMMPKIDGFKLCGLLKSDQRYSSIPVIILSSRAGDDDVELSQQVGAAAYMLKPVDLKILTEKIESVLNQNA